MTILKKNKKFNGDLLHDRRVRQKLSLRQLSQKINISITAISKWETNAYGPRPNSLIELSKILKVKPEYFYGATN